MPKKESFKQSMDRLDEIIARLNQNEVELEEAITLFEEGLKLVKQCDARLKQFEQRVSVLSEVKEEEGKDV
ncbi:MAG TPA: exodeoxyribonuclease VII small subunit [Candidatus Merdibacter merdipullorum]|nr:exodeoxyribonuclease VII small subunit [Candidatus Merdibacter merdipullorum]